ncbi:alkaline phosphatase family protein [Desulfurococcaceae archaeon MEX13E-LK6-19]|nr:alkaline phosphatase family protein [Desulfurococcaceae archaeon MEX13E-LK6-19]
MGKLALIGLDGMSWHVLLSYQDAFKSTLKLASNGMRGICWSIPPYTPPSWISISTGVHPLKHKILGFTKPLIDKKGNVKTVLIKSTDIKYPRLSEILSMNGMKSLVINHIFSYPLTGWFLFNHVIVSDDTSPQKIIFPRKFNMFLKYFQCSIKGSKESDKWIVDLAQKLEAKIEGIHKLIQEVEPDFLWVMFKEPDIIMHYLQFVAAGLHNDKVMEVFSLIDDFIDYVKKQFDYVVIVSDHGFNVYINRLNVYSILAKGLHLEETKRAILLKIFVLPLSKYVTWFLLSSMFKQSLWYKLRHYISLYFGSRKKFCNKINNVNNSTIFFDEVDADDAFIVYILDDEIFKKAISILKRHKLIEDATPFDIGGIKGILVVPKKGLHFINNRAYKEELIYFAASRHSPAGLYIIYGKHLSSEVRNINNYDIAPTVLSLLKIPLATHFDGKPLVLQPQLEKKDYLSKYYLLKKLYKIKEKVSLGGIYG